MQRGVGKAEVAIITDEPVCTFSIACYLINFDWH